MWTLQLLEYSLARLSSAYPTSGSPLLVRSNSTWDPVSDLCCSSGVYDYCSSISCYPCAWWMILSTPLSRYSITCSISSGPIAGP